MKLTLFKYLIIGNMIMLGFVIFLGGYVAYTLGQLHGLSKDIVEIDTRSVTLCDGLSIALSDLVMLEKKYIISRDADYHEKYTEIKTVFENDMRLLLLLVKDEVVQQQALEMKQQFENYLRLFDEQVMMLKEVPETEDVSMFLEGRKKEILSVESELKQIAAAMNDARMSKILQTRSMINDSIRLTVIITIVATVLGILIAAGTTRNITRSIFLLEKKTREISDGQFNHIASIAAAPKEINDLIQHFNVMSTRLKELEVMKTDFIGHFSHELKTPVTSIKQAAGMLNMNLFKSDPQKEKELSQLIMTECDRLISSIERILDLSRMEVFQMEYQFQKADLGGVIRDALLKFKPEAQNRQIHLEMIPSTGTLPLCRMDIKRIDEVMNNLISNALKYTEEYGKIIITVSAVADNKEIMVSVSDNGCGIDQENLVKIFVKFKRIDNGNQTLRGTGLGLAITKHIIKAHKGEIWAESELLTGTKITFILPAA